MNQEKQNTQGQTENEGSESERPALQALGLIVKASMTTPNKPGKQPRPVWIVEGLISGFEALFRDLGGHKWRGAWSFWSDPSQDILAHANQKMSVAEIQEYRSSRKLDKTERYLGYADSAMKRAESAQDRVDAICSRIPLGQPILVGHHSERGARADQRRIHNGMRQICEESGKARYFAGQARSLERDAKSAKSVEYLGNRIKECEAEVSQFRRYLNGQYYVYSEPGSMLLSDELRARYEVY